jgi:4-amino-4-deoxy-L-arabinose transferase-like glycosyltransferase
MGLLLVLPLASFLLFLLVFLGRGDREKHDRDPWQAAFIKATVAWGIIVILMSEGLSSFDLLSRAGVSVGWSVTDFAIFLIGYRRGFLKSGWERLQHLTTIAKDRDSFLFVGMAMIVVTLFLIAVISPPNNVDSFIYHMTRVVHWAENQSLSHYPATQDHQLYKPIWAEAAILHIRLLWGSDRPANLVQWFSMVGSLVAVSGIARQLGAGRRGQLLAAAFVVSIPMGILQSSTTQNDYVSAYWGISLAYFAAISLRRSLGMTEWIAVAAIMGLGVLTKGTFFVYFPASLAAILIASAYRTGLIRAFALGSFVAVIVVALNLGFWLRNIETFGGPYGRPSSLGANLWIDKFIPNGSESSLGSDGLVLGFEDRPRASGATVFVTTVSRNLEKVPDPRTFYLTEIPSSNAINSSAASEGLAGTIADLFKRHLKMIGRNFMAPVGVVNRVFLTFFESTPSIYGPEYAAEMAEAAWNHEDTAGNPIHLLMIPLSIIGLTIVRRRVNLSRIGLYVVLVLGSYAILPVVIGHGTIVWALRYQLGIFVLWAPVVGVVFSGWQKVKVPDLLTGGFLLASLPWLLLNNMRPIIGMPPWPTSTESILVASQEDILFATNPRLVDDYVMATDALKKSGCKTVGMRLETQDLEYPLWWLMSAPESGIALELLNAGAHTNRYAEADFEPCAVLCTNCGEREEVYGLGRMEDFGLFTLFIAPAWQAGSGDA